jgi:hypothetical protein
MAFGAMMSRSRLTGVAASYTVAAAARRRLIGSEPVVEHLQADAQHFRTAALVAVARSSVEQMTCFSMPASATDRRVRRATLGFAHASPANRARPAFGQPDEGPLHGVA